MKISFFAIVLLLFVLLSLSKETSETMRGKAIAFFAPSWSALNFVKVTSLNIWNSIGEKAAHEAKNEVRIQNLLLQNQILFEENQKLKELFQADWGGMDAREDLATAEVIFRSPSTWNSSLWINVGTETNQNLGKIIVAKNSPVLYGRSLVGVIDYAGLNQSRVRLITDSGLTPSVRAVRFQGESSHFLAKGELYGSSAPLWRQETHRLKGIGFNYDFADAEGPARDLRTGKSQDPTRPKPALPLIQVGDHLLTTGLDGLFPTGLDVAIVAKVHPLKEGDYYYEIEADATAGNLDRLSFVFVLPPLGFDSLDQPILD